MPWERLTSRTRKGAPATAPLPEPSAAGG
jgi:hypothetical protein